MRRGAIGIERPVGDRLDLGDGFGFRGGRKRDRGGGGEHWDVAQQHASKTSLARAALADGAVAEMGQ